MNRLIVLSVVLVISLLVAACAPLMTSPAPVEVEATPTPQQETAAPDIVDTAVAAGQFTTLVTALQAADLVSALKGEGPFTVFAPTDEAFANLPAGALDGLLADTSALSSVLLYHVLPGKIMAADVMDGVTAETLEGSPVTFSVSDGVVKINDATIVATDIEAANGVIHVINAVILPPSGEAAPAEEMPIEALDIVDTAAAAGQFSTLLAAAEAAGLVDALKGAGPFTVFAPTDEAFAKIPAETLQALLADPTALGNILLYHVLPGKIMAADVADGLTAETLQGASVGFSLADGIAKINDATIVATDVMAANGVIHVIDTVILPPAAEEGTSDATEGEAAAAGADIVDTATAAGQFTTLLTAAQAAGLVETLKSAGPFTVFAPSNEAFAKLPAGTVESLLNNPAKLKDILLYHVVAGRYTGADLVKRGVISTALGRSLPINAAMGGQVKVGDANVVGADIEAANGIIHVIDTVLLP